MQCQWLSGDFNKPFQSSVLKTESETDMFLSPLLNLKLSAVLPCPRNLDNHEHQAKVFSIVWTDTKLQAEGSAAVVSGSQRAPTALTLEFLHHGLGVAGCQLHGQESAACKNKQKVIRNSTAHKSPS